MATDTAAYWFKKYLDVQFSGDADSAAQNLVKMFTERYSSYGPFYKGEFERGNKLKLLTNFISEHLPQDYALDGNVWNLQDVIKIGARDRRSSNWSEEDVAAMDMYPSVLSIINRYDN
jgi:hypothetical protein